MSRQTGMALLSWPGPVWAQQELWRPLPSHQESSLGGGGRVIPLPSAGFTYCPHRVLPAPGKCCMYWGHWEDTCIPRMLPCAPQ